jgi:hypothetical protein
VTSVLILIFVGVEMSKFFDRILFFSFRQDYRIYFFLERITGFM